MRLATPASMVAGTKISRSGVPRIGADYTETMAFFCEFIATGVYMYAFMAFSYDSRIHKNMLGISVGGSVIAGIISTGPITGGVLNPTRVLGPALISAVVNWRNPVGDFESIWYYFLGPIFGAVLVAFYYEYFMILDEDQNPDLSVASYEKDDKYKLLVI